MARSRWLLLATLVSVTGCLPATRAVTPPAPAQDAARPAPPVRAAASAAAPRAATPDSIRAAQDSILDNAVLEQLAESHAPGESAAQAADELEGIASGRALDVTTYADHPRVRYYLDFFQGPARARMHVWLGRLPVYEPLIRATFARYGIPSDLLYLGLIESGYSNSAVSRSRAVGMWQFMLPTGKWMGLRVDRWVDERRDPVRATDAAARYLQKLADQFGSYYLAAAAYNGGPGTVSRGLDRLDLSTARAEGDGSEVVEEEELEYTDEHFFTLADSRYIRQETKDYVPKLIAAALIARDPMAYGFDPVPEAPPFPTDSIVVPDATGLDVLARLADVPLAALVALNPHYLRKMTPPGKPSVVRLPSASTAQVAARYAELPAAERVDRAALARLAAADVPSRGRLHTVKRGETLGGIATRYRVTQAQLRSWNRLPKSGLIRVGQKLRVSGGAAPTSVASAAGGTHLVRRGDTLSSIARRYGTSVQALQDINNLASPRALKAGQRIRIPS